eukprot:360291-Chlamydomonas_euryale.AAC.4
MTATANAREFTAVPTSSPLAATAAGQGGLGKAVCRPRHLPDLPDSCPRSSARFSVLTPPGATGLVGSRLTAKLSAMGYTVHALTRSPGSAKSKLPFANVRCVGPADWEAALRDAYGVVNLAGEPIATRAGAPQARGAGAWGEGDSTCLVEEWATVAAMHMGGCSARGSTPAGTHRWTTELKQQILASRVNVTNRVVVGCRLACDQQRPLNLCHCRYLH